ncbi:Putative ribonuclease H protein [Dendrobium catenatum]|uniref:Ribonuclease H protein n=1 Tax=Dendrobium catenatum TaxID=906689 RepID=A0A2I0VDE8_9ASPA|nr:Putative ribonuclease H protein [Dendrobium catenatum]
MECIEEPSYSILINGGYTKWIKGKSGFCQGCPLSPFLFIICSQLLSNVFLSRGTNLGIKIAYKSQKISHLLYADDVLLFTDAKKKNLRRLKEITEDYCSWTGQRINYHKYYMIYGKKVDRRKKKMIEDFMGFKAVNEMEYLGVKVALRRLKKRDYQFLLDKSLKKLNSWSNKFISLAGRMVLVNSVYVNFPVFISSHSLIPLGVLKEFEKLCRDIIWNKADGSHGLHYVAWNELCKPKALGGWGIKFAFSSVGPLRAKFAWKLLKDPDTFVEQEYAN